MRFWLIGLLALFCSPAFAQQQTPPTIAFDSVPDPLKLPDNMYFGEVSGIAVNSKGHIFVLTRGNSTGPAYAAAAAQLLEFGPDGQYLREIGHELYAWSFAHMVKIDRHDNLGHRQRLGHGDKIYAARARGHGVRAQAGSLR